jgi:hypothetical protein
LLFSPIGSCVALRLQLCLVSSSPSKLGQFNFEWCPLSQEISSWIHHLPWCVRLARDPTPTLNLCASPDLCWVLVAPLVGCPCSQPLLLFPCFTETLPPCPSSVLLGRFSVPFPPPLLVLDYSSLFTFFSCLVVWGSVCSGAVLDYFPMGWVEESHMVCDAQLFVLQIHISSFGAGWQGEMVQHFSLWHREDLGPGCSRV